MLVPYKQYYRAKKCYRKKYLRRRYACRLYVDVVRPTQTFYNCDVQSKNLREMCDFFPIQKVCCDIRDRHLEFSLG